MIFAEEVEVEWFYEDLQDLLELTPIKDVLFIIGDWNAKVGSQETPGVTGKFGLGIRKAAGQRLIEFCQENALVIANTLFQQHKRRLYTWTSPDGTCWLWGSKYLSWDFGERLQKACTLLASAPPEPEPWPQSLAS